MKIFALCSLTASASAFTISSYGHSGSSRLISSSSPLFAEASAARINNMIDLDSPKVVNQESLKAGDKKVYCRCWKSGTFPLCDAAHAKHNQETGDNVGPLIVSCSKEE